MINLLSPEQVDTEKRAEELRFKTRLAGYATEETRLVRLINTARVELLGLEKTKGAVLRYLQDHGEWVERIEAIEDREDLLLRREQAVAKEETRLKQSENLLSEKWVAYYTAIAKINGAIPLASSV